MKFVRPLLPFYLIGFLFSVHTALILYSNSSFLNQFIPETSLGLLYTGGSIAAIIGLLLVPKLITRFGSRITLLGIILLTIIICIINAVVVIPWVIFIAFGLLFGSNIMFFLSNDIFIDQVANNDQMGTIRGTYLTAVNLGYIAAPGLSGFILARMGFPALYSVAAILLIPLIFLIVITPPVTQLHKTKINIWKSLITIVKNRNLRNIVGANFLLQFFYCWMVIYTPIYLHETLGIPWDSIGTIFSLMLLAFALTQIPLGKIADTYLGEKPLLFIGFIIMGTATSLLYFLPYFTLPLLALVLFGTRIGASCVEVLTESYFFKKVDKTETGAMSIFRNTYPLAYIIAPLIGSLVITIGSPKLLFLVLGIICVSGIFFILPITNTK